MSIKQFNRAAPLDFPSFIGQNGSSYDAQNNLSTVSQMLLSQYELTVFLGRSASRDSLITQ